MEKTLKDNKMLSALEVIYAENQTLQNTLQEVLLTRKSLETNLDSGEKQLSTLLQEEYKLQAIHVINLMKIETVEKEVKQFEEKQELVTGHIQNVVEKIKEYKENSDTKTNQFTKDAEYLCECFLSVIHNETAESDRLKIFDEINKLKLEIIQKEEVIAHTKRELEEFVIFEVHDNATELSVTLEQREALKSVIENQILMAIHELEELNHLKSDKQFEEFQLVQER